MKQTLLSLIAIAFLTGCNAAETNSTTETLAGMANTIEALSQRFNELNERYSRHAANAVIDSLRSNTWANVPGGVEVRRFSLTNLENYQIVSGERTPEGIVTNAVFAPTVMRIKTYIQPFQIVQWPNESNILESVEWPLIQPRLLSETLKTNVVTSAK